ncbi:MAG: DUF1614 domain-containing protein [Firmicutes bacterium]|nr:DUF1614 domain-containing protein [Bacillota bacterium]
MFNITAFGLLALLLALLYLGALERVLERMRLTGKQALLLLFAMLAGGLLPPVTFAGGLKVNIGGVFIPLALVIYLLVTADAPNEKYRALLAAGVTGLLVRTAAFLLPGTPGVGHFDLDPLFLPPLLAAFVAYLLGRSRRASFIGAFLGVLSVELWAWGENLQRGLRAHTFTLGGGGVWGAALLAGVLAVLLAELVGEIRERLHRRRVE